MWGLDHAGLLAGEAGWGGATCPGRPYRGVGSASRLSHLTPYKAPSDSRHPSSPANAPCAPDTVWETVCVGTES